MRDHFEPEQAIEVMRASRPYARANPWVASWQIGSTLAILLGALALASWLSPSPWLALLVPLVTGLFIRIFVFQHDLGHRSMFRGRRANDRLGYALSVITSVPFEAWRAEHNWHHNHQGRLSKRGVDNMNSPMTLAEVPERPAEARYRVNKISAPNIFLIGSYSLLVERKRPDGFFPFRETFEDPVRRRDAMLRGIFWTLPAHLVLQGLVAWVFGWWVPVFVVVPAMFIGAGIGGVMFWVQHNFEHTYYADDEDWNKTNVAVHGSSYVRFGAVLRWFTGSIGLHHVHHLNPGIPNYALERARRGIPSLAEVEPLDALALRRSFTHLFWDPEAKRMCPPSELEVPLDE